jgi:hypothetical protein
LSGKKELEEVNCENGRTAKGEGKTGRGQTGKKLISEFWKEDATTVRPADP